MRFPIAAIAGTIALAFCATASAQDRYGASSSAISSSSDNRFEDLFSKESTRSSQPGTTRPATASSKRGSSSFDLRPLNNSTSPNGTSTSSRNSTGTRSTAGSKASTDTRASTGTTGPSTKPSSSDPFARNNTGARSTSTQSNTGRSNTGRANPTTRSSSTASTTSGGRSSRFDSRTPSYNRNQSSSTPSNAYSRDSSVLVDSSQDRFANDRQVDQGGQREAATRNMLSRMLKAHPNSRLTGTPMPLSNLLSSDVSRDRQSQLIEAYWALTSATADYYLGLHEADELGKLRQRVPTYSTALNDALSHLNVRVDTSLKAARAAQLHLGRLSNAGTRTLPADTPFCGPYVTRYEEIFAGRGSEQARLLSELLPARLNELQEASEAVERSEQWLSKVAADRASGGSGTGMIRALELLALNRRAFVQIAKDYNLQISRYTRLATPGDIDTGRLVAMLIRTSPTLADNSSIANGRSLDLSDSATSSRR